MIIDLLDEAKEDIIIKDEVIKVWLVLDNRRDPEWIARQLIP